MKRDISELSSETFDILIVGAGIYGATAAWDAATRGLSVAVIDQGDFGWATSANSLKTVHGGLRYLQQLDVIRMRESIRERRLLLQMAPHLVHPLSCVMPTYGHLMKGPEIMRIGLLLNDIISYDRNHLSDPQKFIPMGKVLTRTEALRLLPGVKPDGINGGAFWTDAQMFNSDRLVLAFIQSAESAGAQAANYVRAVKFIKNKDRIQGVQAKDLITGNMFEIRSRIVVNMAGGWTDTLLQTLGKPSSRIRLSTAMNLIINRPLLSECAAGIRARFEYPRPNGGVYKGYRVLFMSPWRNHTMVGTYHRPYDGNPDDLHVTDDEIACFLKEINSAWSGDPIRQEEITFVHKGFLPMDGIQPKTGDVILTKHYKIYDHAEEDQLDGMLSVVGVKYTTARDVSEKVINRVFTKLNRKPIPNRIRYLRVFGGDMKRFEDILSIAQSNPLQACNDYVMSRLVKNYGTNYRKLLQKGAAGSEPVNLLPGSTDVLNSEIFHAVTDEMVHYLTDLVLRRTDMGSAGYPGNEAVEAAATIMANALGWKDVQKEEEIRKLRQYYQRMGVTVV
ncbi:glycerol-3-phosphate dehydrogenase/oxidase [bacterium]|nr:glycerol-3-phosphate dehydrogenase/oxidase [bacterium]